MSIGSLFRKAFHGLKSVFTGGDADTQKVQVKNIVNNFIDITNTQVVNIVNETTTSVSNTLIDAQKANNTDSANAGNTVFIKNVTVYGTLSIAQSAELQATATAVVQIVHNADQLAKMATQITDQVKDKINAATDLKSDIVTVQSLTKSNSIDGEVNDLVGVLGSLFANSQKTEADVETEINNHFNITNSQSTNIDTIVNNIIGTTIDSKTITNCISKTASFNNSDIENITVYGTLIDTQTALATNLSNCAVNSLLQIQDLIDISNKTINDAKEKADATAAGDTTANTNNTLQDLHTVTSLVTDMMRYITYIIIGVVVCVIIVVSVIVGIPLLKGMSVHMHHSIGHTARTAAGAAANGAAAVL